MKRTTFMNGTAGIAAFALAAGAIVFLHGAPWSPAIGALAQAPATVGFIDAQARQGRGVFGGCENCHGNDLGGLDGGPPLKGETFERWFAMPPADLFTFIAENMPADMPGTLRPPQVAQVMSYILQTNGFAAGTTELPADPAALATMTYPAR